MAKLKKTVMQRSFTHMEIREDFLEGDDLELRGMSVRSALNMKALATRTAEARPGTFMERALTNADEAIEIRPETGLKFGLIINDTSFQIIDKLANVVHEELNVSWTDATEVWVNPFRKDTILGSETGGIWILSYDAGTWSFTEYGFEETSGGELAQPYWAYEKTATIQPSAASGTITLTASKPIWEAEYVGQRIRYGAREIKITERISSTILRGNVVSQLPPSFAVTVADGSVFRVGEAVVGADTNFQGLIVSIYGAILNVVTKTFFEGPDVGEEMSGPAGSSLISIVNKISPLPSPLWDEPLMSPLRGFPRASGKVAGRIVFIDFANVPDLVALSSSRDIKDFKVGAEDDDAIVRQVGDGAPRWLHAVNMGDLLLFSDSGVYNVPLRDTGIMSPSTFNPVIVDETGSSEISPVKVEDGVIFVDASGEGVAAVFLDGNVYLKWSVRPLTTFHNHLISEPKRLCGPSLGSKAAEKYLFVINGDGSLAAVSWTKSIRDEKVGFAPWKTAGQFVSVSPIFGGYWAIVDRDLPSGTTRFLERFSEEAFLDCATSTSDTTDAQFLSVNGADLMVNGVELVVSSPSALHLIGSTVSYYAGGWDLGDFLVADDGTIETGVAISGARQVGINFEAELKPWPVEAIESPRIGTLKARVLQLIVSVQHTLAYEVRCNSTVQKVDAYSFGDDLSVPPKLKTEVRRFTVYGNRDHPEMVVAKRRPGPFRVLATGQRVTA